MSGTKGFALSARVDTGGVDDELCISICACCMEETPSLTRATPMNNIPQLSLASFLYQFCAVASVNKDSKNGCKQHSAVEEAEAAERAVKHCHDREKVNCGKSN